MSEGERLRSTDKAPIHELLREAADRLEADPGLSLNWELFDGELRPTAYHLDGRVYVSISKRMMLSMTPAMATRLAMHLAHASIEGIRFEATTERRAAQETQE